MSIDGSHFILACELLLNMFDLNDRVLENGGQSAWNHGPDAPEVSLEMGRSLSGDKAELWVTCLLITATASCSLAPTGSF